MTIAWRSIAHHLLQVVAFCCVIAVLTTAIWPRHSYGVQLVGSLCIGLVTWAVIEFGRLLVPARLCHTDSEGGHGWPKGWRGGALAAAGIGTGFLLGDPLGQWLTGTGGYRSARDGQLSLLITIAAGAVATYYFHMRGRAAALEAARNAAERDASEARLKLLQSQLEPHMLFNTLANLRALIGVDPAAAQQMLDRLNDYLRATLAASRATRHPLAAEFERLRDYLALMAIRMGPRLAFELRLPDELRESPVPPLLLQPLVENAIQHGLEPRVGGGRIDVSAAREGDALVLAVRDTGVGFDPAHRPAGRFGMAQVTERVLSAYGGRGRVDVQSRPGEGAMIRLTLPL
ncbi:MAG: histidine kinase [Ottowia sp.]|uniref:sensor histidine kinase n=1 Tax=Ottowia sp. TaxID=1898956 RepID=UPI0039E463C3